MTDYFYEQADKLGMLVWQDLMFSCKLYPFYQEAFITSSLKEVREQVGRLQYHSSIAFWVLNNEGENIVQWGNSATKKLHDGYIQQYESFYIDKVLPVLEQTGIRI